MFAYFGLGPQEMILLALMALVMVVGPIIAVFLGLTLMRRLYHVELREVGHH